MVSGHRSTQDTSSLKSLANKLKGIYHQGNNRHLPSEVLARLSMVQPRFGEGIGLREFALGCLVVGGSLVTLIRPALVLIGRKGTELPSVPVLNTARANVQLQKAVN